MVPDDPGRCPRIAKGKAANALDDALGGFANPLVVRSSIGRSSARFPKQLSI